MSERQFMAAIDRADALADDGEGSRWMTIAELAESRQISKASAQRLVRRRRWRRMPDNRGTIRVYVPIGQELPQEQPADARADIPADGTLEILAVVSAKDETIAGHLAHIGTLKDALAKAEARADDLQRQVDQWRVAGWWRRRRLRRGSGGKSGAGGCPGPGLGFAVIACED